jgi:predicted RNA-binding protein with RPS1 domain
MTTTLRRPGSDMHDQGVVPPPPDDERFGAGEIVRGVVICHHSFGIGIRVAERDQYGHVDVSQISWGVIRGREDYPPLGTVVEARVLGYSGAQTQLQLSLQTS